MVFLLLTLLFFSLGDCLGQTQFIYSTKKEQTITCETKKWQISTDSNNIIDLNCPEGCYLLKIQLKEDEEKECEKKIDKPNFCLLKVKSGFVACVNYDLPGFLFPFKRSSNVLQSFIVAVPDKNLTSEPEKTSSLTVTEGESVNLNCSFTFTKEHDGNAFVVYWIKTKGQSSTCLYSYDFSAEGIKVNHQCEVEETLNKRLSNRTIEKLTHNIGISGVMESDSGQYLCALHMDTSKTDKKTNVKWKVIERVTVRVIKDKSPTTARTEKTPEETHEPVSVGKDKTPQSPETTSTEETPEKRTEERNGSDPLMPLYTSWPIGLALLFSVWVTFAFLRNKAMSSQGSQSVELQSNQQ